MARFPWRRNNADATPPSLDTYLSVNPIDYTALSVDEDNGLAARFHRLPFVVRVALFLVPLLLLGGLGWAGYRLVAGPEQPAIVPAPVPPQLQLSAARVVNPQEIVVMGTTQDVPDGTNVTARVLEDGEPIAWSEPSENVDVVKDNAISLRVRKSSSWTQPLSEDASYTVELTVDSSPAVSASQEVDVPEPLAESFFGVAAVAATAEPTVAPPQPMSTLEATPEPEPTAAPIPTTAPTPGLATLTVGANATLLVSPTLGSSVISTAASGASYQPLLRTPDGQFFLVYEGNRVGWLPAGQVSIDPAQVAQIALTTPAKEAVEAGPLRARVFNGGNIRYGPSRTTGTVLGQLHAGETITVKERTADGVWYHVVAPEAEGWVHVSLLQIEPSVLNQVPTVN